MAIANTSDSPAADAARIVVVDDEASVRHFVNRMLRNAGYMTEVAGGGPEALIVIEKIGSFDLLLTDVVMPEINGDELARQVRHEHPNIKVLYLTGFSDRLFKDEIALSEDEAFLDKPFTGPALLEAVSLVLFGHTHGPQTR